VLLHPNERTPGAVSVVFQWAPTLGGECYWAGVPEALRPDRIKFQWAPTLGGECYRDAMKLTEHEKRYVSMGTHPWG